MDRDATTLEVSLVEDGNASASSAVLRGPAAGQRNGEIAAELFLSLRTVKFKVGKIFDTLGVRTGAEAAAVAFAAGLGPIAAAA